MLSEDLPIHRHLMRPPGGWRTRMAQWWESEADFRAHILERLAEQGPLRARDIEDRATRRVGVQRLDATRATSPACWT